MALAIGQMHRLQVLRVSRQAVRLTDGHDEVTLEPRQAPTGIAVGDEVEVFVYSDGQGQLIATAERPHACVGEIAAMTVRSITAHGAFLDWGITKDLFVPFAEQEQRLKLNRAAVVAVRVHTPTQRVIGTTRFERAFDPDVSQFVPGQAVALLPYRRTELGVQCVVDRRACGMLFFSDLYVDVRLLDAITGYVKFVRQDGKLDVTLRPQGAAARDQDAEVILDALHEAGGYLPLHDKSPPEQIERVLQLSKKAFKRASGNLYRARRITIEEDGIRLSD